MMIFRLFIAFIYHSLLINAAFSQSPIIPCPTNLDFEQGSLTNWQCYTGSRSSGVFVLGPTAAVTGRHELITKSVNKDPKAQFTLSPPDESQYFVKLGNSSVGAEVESIAYTFTVPTNDYTIVYNYASVFEDDPSESTAQKPGFSVKVYDAITGLLLPCLSADRFADRNAANAQFINSTVYTYFIPWTTSSINLGAYAGRSVRIEFSTYDCYFPGGGGHFQYVYLDINSGCRPAVTGNYYCDPVSLTLKAPPGFDTYNWFNGSGAAVGSGDQLYLDPAPAPGTMFTVDAAMLANPACKQTFTTSIQAGTPVGIFRVVPLVNGCESMPVDITRPEITMGSEPGLTFTYYSDAALTQPIPNPRAIINNGIYFIKATNAFNCASFKPIEVKVYPATFTITDPPAAYFPYSIDLTHPSVTAGSSPGLIFSYWSDAGASNSVIANPAQINQSGVYYIKASNPGCSEVKAVNVVIKTAIPNTFTPNGDGTNDVFKALAFTGVRTNFFKVYNRHGKLVFDNIKNGDVWDGTFEGKKLPSGNYYWIWSGFDQNSNSSIQNSGSITLIR